MLEYVFGWWETGVISIFLFGEYPMPIEEDTEE